MRPRTSAAEKKAMLQRGHLLREYRRNNKISQARMAKMLGVKTQQVVVYMEKNGISLENAIEYEKKLKISLGVNSGQIKTPSTDSVSEIKKLEAIVKVLMHRQAKRDSKETGRSIQDCIKDIEDDIELAMR